MSSYQVVLIPWQDHDVIQVCSLGTMTSGGGEMDALLKCVVSGARGFLLLHPIMVDA
jgi:hypothetical protein